MNGIIYCRVSSKEQIEGTSLESQELACGEYARSKNIKILKTFVEQGESAKFADRTQLLQLIDFCRQNKGKVEVLLVWKVDRFARNVSDHFNIKAALTKYGVRIVSVTEPIDANPEGRLMETILAGFAQFDNDIRAMRTVQGMRRKLQEGIFPWKPPLGYKTVTKSGEKKTEPDQPDQPLFGLLQKAWQEFATGSYTKAEILRLMTSWGVMTSKGRPLSPQSLDNFFRNQYYTGILVDPWSGEEHEGRHTPMVSRADFARVQQISGKRNHSIPHQKERPEFPLRGLVRCNECRRYMTSSFSRGRSQRYPYYHCGYPLCRRRGKTHTVDAIHSEFEGFLNVIAPKQESIEKLADVMVQVADERYAFTKTKRVRVETQLASLNRELQGLIRMRAQGLITDNEFIGQKAALLEKRNALESRPKPQNISEAEIREQLSEITAPLTQLPVTWESLVNPDNPARRRRFERLVLPVGFENERIRTANLGLLFRVFGQSSAQDSSLGCLVRKCWNQIWQEIRAFSRLFKSDEEPEEGLEIAVRRNSRE